MRLCMTIDPELFSTLPEWDVPALDLAAGKTYFFRDGNEAIRYRDGSITRAKVVLSPSYYEPMADKGNDLVQLLQESPDGPICTLEFRTDEHGAPIPESVVNSMPPDKGSCTRTTIEAVCTRDDDGIYLRCKACGWTKELDNCMTVETLVKEADDHQYRDDQTEPVANAVDGSDVVYEELPEYEILKELWDGLPFERRDTGGYWRDDHYIYYQPIGQAKPTKMRVKFTEIPF